MAVEYLECPKFSSINIWLLFFHCVMGLLCVIASGVLLNIMYWMLMNFSKCQAWFIISMFGVQKSERGRGCGWSAYLCQLRVTFKKDWGAFRTDIVICDEFCEWMGMIMPLLNLGPFLWALCRYGFMALWKAFLRILSQLVCFHEIHL